MNKADNGIMYKKLLKVEEEEKLCGNEIIA